jgi:hypothetical protein
MSSLEAERSAEFPSGVSIPVVIDAQDTRLEREIGPAAHKIAAMRGIADKIVANEWNSLRKYFEMGLIVEELVCEGRTLKEQAHLLGDLPGFGYRTLGYAAQFVKHVSNDFEGDVTKVPYLNWHEAVESLPRSTRSRQAVLSPLITKALNRLAELLSSEDFLNCEQSIKNGIADKLESLAKSLRESQVSLPQQEA